jgi:hypothetical protein
MPATTTGSSHVKRSGWRRIGKDSGPKPSWADFLAETQAELNVTLLHEFIHSFFNLTAPDHSDIVSKFNITVNSGESDSHAVDRWINHDCKN